MQKSLRPVRTNYALSYRIKSSKNFSLVFVLLLLFSIKVKSQSLPSGFSQVLVANGISSPTVMAFAPDGRIFVAQQNGQLRVIKNGSLLSQPFVSLSVNSSGERGLLGIAFDPNFSSNHYVYLYYTVSSAQYNRISRFTANGDVASGGEQVILNLDPLSDAANHNGGTMQFGPDGKLYIGVGENANSSYSQRTDTYHGKILRINPDGSVPPGNPFTSGNNQQLRIWAWGVRNPYTIAFQPGTGKLFVNDVGGSSWEEINDATSGGKNFGWPNEEGWGESFASPVYAYGHGGGIGSGCAITGGTFFNPSSTNYPPSYYGKYFFMDYCNNWIDMLTLSGGSASRANFASNIAGSALGLVTGTDGNLYFLSRDNNAVYKIVYAGGSSAPVITNQPQNLTVSEGNNATFNVTATGTAPLNYQWRKNGSNISGANSSSYTITSADAADAGTYSVAVSNSAGSVTSNNATLTVTQVNEPPVATINTPTAGTTYAGGSVINFSGTATDPNGSLGSGAYTWYVIFHHDTHNHPGPSVTANGSSGSFTIPAAGETAANVFYRLYLVVTDPQGAKDTAYRDVLPRTSTITLNTNPQGLTVTLDGQPFTAPLTVTSVEGVVRSIGTPSPQNNNGTSYTFTSWAHGGNQTQTIATPVNNTTYTANFSSSVVITNQPQSITVVQGNNATFSVTATGTPPLSYQWRKNGTNINGANNSTYTISSVNSSHAGNYSVVVRNASGSVTSNNATLTVTTAPVITSQPQSITTAQGSNATFTVTATGSAPLSYQWRKNGTNVGGANGSSYTISSVTTADAGNYSVVVNNNYGNVTSSNATLTVTTAPAITSQPQNFTASQGSNATFTVTATGTAPLSYQWRKNGTNVGGANGSSYTISAVTTADAGNYSVVVSNSYGNVTSNNATLTVTTAPVITSQPQSITTAQGSNATFMVTATGSAPLSYQWRKNGTNVGGANGSSYTISSVTTADAGNYSVVVNNNYGNVTSNNATLTVTTTPVITSQPQSIIATEGSIASFSVTASGTAPLSYQWRKNGVIISGANSSSYTIASVNASHAGNYSVVVSNDYGTATSNNVTLAVTSDSDDGSLRDPDDPENPVNGLDYSYYHGTWTQIPDFSTLRKEKSGTVNNFNLTPRMENDNFGLRFEGYISVPADGIYIFYVSSDEGSRLYIGDSLIVSNDGLHSVQERSGQIGLKAGLHYIRVEYFEKSMSQELAVSYEGPGIAKQVIPDAILFREVPSVYVLNTFGDAHVQSGHLTNVNFGSYPVMWLGNPDDTYEIFLRFDISSLRADISSAKLRLYGGLNSTTISSATVNAYDVASQSWLERTITNSNKPSAGSAVLASTTVGNDAWYYEWDLTSHINNLRNNGQLYVSLLVKCASSTGNGMIDFNARENSANKPELKIEYAAPTTGTRPVGNSTTTLSSNSNSNPGNITKMPQGLNMASACFAIYPNPLRDNFTISYSALFRNRKLQITDMNGRVLKEVYLSGTNTQNIRTDELKAGTYLLSITTGKTKCSQKIMIAK